jgi:hypothetical protein
MEEYIGYSSVESTCVDLTNAFYCNKAISLRTRLV